MKQKINSKLLEILKLSDALRLILYMTSICLLWNCQPDTVSADRYAKHIRKAEASLIQQEATDKFIYQAQYLPQAYQALKSSQLNKRPLSEELDLHAGHQYFALTIQPKNAQPIESNLDPKIAKENMNRLRFHAQTQLKAIFGRDTLPCVLYHMEFNPIANNSETLHLVFQDQLEQRTDFSGEVSLLFEDTYLSQQELIFSFNERKINQLPTLKL